MNEEIYFVSPTHSPEPFYINICGKSFCDGSYYIVRPHSSILCMEYIYSGTGTIRYRGKEYHPSAGDVYALPIGERHEYYSDPDSPWVKIWFNAAGSLCEELLRIYGLQDTPLYEAVDLHEDFERLLAIACSGSPVQGINEQCGLVFHTMLQKLYAAHRPLQSLSPEAATLRDYLDTHFAESVSIDRLAAQIYKSRSQTIRIFKSEFGVTPYDYLLDSRIRNAKSLIRGTNLLIREIAERVGFTDEHYFSDLFKRKTGRTPSSYRHGSSSETQKFIGSKLCVPEPPETGNITNGCE